MDRAAELLREREIKGLRFTAATRIVFVVMLILVGFLPGGQSRLVVVGGIFLGAIWLGLALVMLRLVGQRKALHLVGYGGALMDVAFLAMVPAIWYHGVGGTEIPASFLLKTFFPFLAVVMLAIHSLALRPLYPALVTAGTVLIQISMYAYVSRDARVVWSSDFVEVFLGGAASALFYFSKVTDVAVVGVLLTMLTHIARRTIHQAVHLETATEVLEKRVEERTADLSRANYILGNQIEERKRTEKALRQSEEKFRGLIESSIQSVVVYRGRKILFANRAAIDTLGFDSAEEFLQLDLIDDLIVPENRAWVDENYEALLKKEGTIRQFETQALRKDGSRIWFYQALAVVDWDGEPAILSAAIDNTERKQAEASLRASERKYRNLIDGSIQGTIIYRDFRILFASQSMLEMLGYDSSEGILGKHLLEDVIAPDDRAHARECLQVVTEPRRMEHHLLKSDGSKVWTEMVASVVDWEGAPSVLVTAQNITERRDAQQALKSSEEKYRNLAQESFQGVVVHRDNRFLYANPAFLNILGYESFEELQKVAMLDLFPPEEQKAVTQRVNQRLAGEVISPFAEYRMLRKDGSPIMVNLMATRVEWEGQPAVQSAVDDVTERLVAEAALKSSEEKYRSLIEGSIQGTFVQRDFEILFANQALAGMLGYESPDDLVGKNILESVFARSQRALILERTEARMRGEEVPNHYEARGVRKDGSELWLDLIATRVNWEGKPAVLANFLDVTERKQAEESLRIKEAAIESSLNAIVFQNLEGDLTCVNGSGLRMFGYREADEILGVGFEEFWNDKALAKNTFRELMERGSWSGEFEAVRKDGTLIDVWAVEGLISGEDGRPICVQASMVDITKRKQAEMGIFEKETALLAAKEASRLKDEFLASMSHELRSPLTSVIGFADRIPQKIEQEQWDRAKPLPEISELPPRTC